VSLRTFEDLAPGFVAEAGPYHVTREALLAFARAYDPQPFHLDDAAGHASPLGGLAASGWHTGAMGMRLFYDGFVSSIASMGSPGITELKWLQPVRADDRLRARIEIVDARPSVTRPDMGLINILLSLTNASDTIVMTQRFPIMVATRVGGVPDAPTVARGRDAPTPDPATIHLGSETFTADAIKTFAKAFDPQPFHLDEDAGRASHFGALVASGWHVAACWMKHMIARSAMEPAFTGRISPGFRDMHWYKPVRAGDTITYTAQTHKARPVARPGWELVSTTNTGLDEAGRLVFAFSGATLQPRSRSRVD
jgi:acyl dehydratase